MFFSLFTDPFNLLVFEIFQHVTQQVEVGRLLLGI